MEVKFDWAAVILLQIWCFLVPKKGENIELNSQFYHYAVEYHRAQNVGPFFKTHSFSLKWHTIIFRNKIQKLNQISMTEYFWKLAFLYIFYFPVILKLRFKFISMNQVLFENKKNPICLDIDKKSSILILFINCMKNYLKKKEHFIVPTSPIGVWSKLHTK